MQVTVDLSLILAICVTVYLMGFSFGTTSSRSLENWNIYVCLFIFTGVLVYRLCRWKRLCQLEKMEDGFEREFSSVSLTEKNAEEPESEEPGKKVQLEGSDQASEEKPSFLEEVFQRVLRVAEGWLEDAVKQKLQDCLEEGFLDFALSENSRFYSDWNLHKLKLQVSDHKPEIRNFEFDEQLLESNHSAERVLSLQGTVAVYFKSFMRFSLVRRAAVVNNKIVLATPTWEEEETFTLTLQVLVKDVALDTRIETELLPEYPFLGSVSFCILEPVNFNIDFHISTDSEVSFLTSSSQDENSVYGDHSLSESSLNQLLFHFIDEAVFRHLAYPNVRTIHFPERTAQEPKTELTINTTDMSVPAFEAGTNTETGENDKLLELHLIEGFLSFKEPCEASALFSSGKAGLYVKLKNSINALIFTSSIAYYSSKLEWSQVWKLPVFHFPGEYISLEVFLGKSMQDDDIYLGRLRLPYDQTTVSSERWYLVKEDLKPFVDVLKLRILMKLSSLTENEESAAFSSNIATPQVTPEVSEQQPKLRRFSSTGSTSQEGTESMLKRLGKKLLFQRESVEVIAHDWSLEDILFHMRAMISKEKGLLKRSEPEMSKGLHFSMTPKRSDDVYSFCGSDAVDWLLMNSSKRISCRSEAVEILRTCADLGIILPLDGHIRRHHGFVDSSTFKCTFSPFFRKYAEQLEEKSHACVLNQGQILVFSTNSLLTGSIEFPMLKASQPVVGLGEKLILHVAELLRKQSFGLDEFVFIPKLEPKYFRFLRTCRKLQYISYDVLRNISPVERMCFFINVYNALFLHCLMVSGVPKSTVGVTEDTSDCCENKTSLFREAICYRIGSKKDKDVLSNLLFSLNDILHGILRCNRSASSCYQDWSDRNSMDSTCKKSSTSEEYPACNVYFSLRDVRAELSMKMADFDPRIHFILLNYPSFQPKMLYLCKPSNLELVLKEATHVFCEQNVDVNEERKMVWLPSIFRNYIEDFLPPEIYGDATGGMDINAAYELLRVAAELLPNDSEKKVALSRVLVSCLDSDKNGSDQLLSECVHLSFQDPSSADQSSVPFITLSKELTHELEISK